MLKFKSGDFEVRIVTGIDDPQADGPEICVEVHATPALGVDRSHIMGWRLCDTPGDHAIAQRLKACIESLHFFTTYEKRTDIYGHTYVSADYVMFLARKMNASLKALGF